MSLWNYLSEKIKPNKNIVYSEAKPENNKIVFGFVETNSLPETSSYIVSKYKSEIQIATKHDYMKYFKSMLGVSPVVFRDKVIEESGWLDEKLIELGIKNTADNRKFFNQMSKLLCGENKVETKTSTLFLVETEEDVDNFLNEI